MAETLHERIERERKSVAPHASSKRGNVGWNIVKIYRLYAQGRQLQTLNADQVRILQGVLRHKFSDNVLKMILKEHASRLRIARFDVEDVAVTKFLFDTWVKNQIPDIAVDLHYATIRDGNAALALDWLPSSDFDNPYGGRVLLTQERWWNGSEGFFLMYDDFGQPEYAVKEWIPLDANPRRRRNVYFPDRIMRFEFADGQWRPVTLPGENDLLMKHADGSVTPGVVPWTKRDGSPLGIPFVHFTNGSDDDSRYGTSLLDGGPLAFQDQINAIQHDITAAALMNGSPQTWSKGFALDKNEDGTIPWESGPGVHHHAEQATADFGILQAGSLAELKNGYFTKLEALCRDTRTPLHVITGQWPSGEALFRADMPIVNAAIELGRTIGPAWASVQHKATELKNAFGSGADLDENSLISTVFDDPTLRDRGALWDIATKASQHVSKREVLRIAGYSPDRIDQIMTEMDEEAATAIASAQAAFSAPPQLDALQRASGAALPAG